MLDACSALPVKPSLLLLLLLVLVVVVVVVLLLMPASPPVCASDSWLSWLSAFNTGICSAVAASASLSVCASLPSSVTPGGGTVPLRRTLCS